MEIQHQITRYENEWNRQTQTIIDTKQNQEQQQKIQKSPYLNTIISIRKHQVSQSQQTQQQEFNTINIEQPFTRIDQDQQQRQKKKAERESAYIQAMHDFKSISNSSKTPFDPLYNLQQTFTLFENQQQDNTITKLQTYQQLTNVEQPSIQQIQQQQSATQYIAVTQFNTLYFYNYQLNTLEKLIQLKNNIKFIRWNQKGNVIFIVQQNDQIAAFDINTHQLIYQKFSEIQIYINDLKPQQIKYCNNFYTINFEGQISEWYANFQDNQIQLLESTQIKQDNKDCALYSIEIGNQCLYITTSSNLLKFDLKTKKIQSFQDYSYNYSQIQYLLQQQQYLLINNQKQIKIISIQLPQRELFQFNFNENIVQIIPIPQSQYLIICTKQEIYLFDFIDQQIKLLQKLTNQFTSACLLMNNQILLIGDQQGQISCFKLQIQNDRYQTKEIEKILDDQLKMNQLIYKQQQETQNNINNNVEYQDQENNFDQNIIEQWKQQLFE